MKVKITSTLLAVILIVLMTTSGAKTSLLYAVNNVMIGLFVIILPKIFSIYRLKKRRSF